MNQSLDDVVRILSGIRRVRTSVRGPPPAPGDHAEHLAKAIATYQRTCLGDRAFDASIDGDESDISILPSAASNVRRQRGSAFCHSGWRFTDDGFHDTGCPTLTSGAAASSRPPSRYTTPSKRPACATSRSAGRTCMMVRCRRLKRSSPIQPGRHPPSQPIRTGRPSRPVAGGTTGHRRFPANPDKSRPSTFVAALPR